MKPKPEAQPVAPEEPGIQSEDEYLSAAASLAAWQSDVAADESAAELLHDLCGFTRDQAVRLAFFRIAYWHSLKNREFLRSQHRGEYYVRRVAQ